VFGITPELYPYFLLQSYFKADNPLEGMVLIIGIGALIVLSLIIHLFRRGIRSTTAMGKSKTAVAPRKFNAFALHRISSAYGLDREQTKLLEFVFKNDGVSDPERVMKTPALLDRHFKRTFKMIEKNSSTDEDAQANLVKLFSLRNTIEAASGAEGVSPGHLSENTPAILTSGKENYTVKVLSSRNQIVVTEIPRNALGTPMRFTKGTKIALSFFTKSSNGFSFDGNVIGTTTTDHGPGLQINHSGKAKPLVKRRFRRKQIDTKCDLFFVNIEESGKGRKKTSRLVVGSKKFTGTILDISAGGCALKASVPMQAGSRLKISMDYADTYFINVLGQVIRVNRSTAGTVFHIKFLKVPQRAFNSISALVFGYSDD
jgi:c-di-GMP-binding flagellar brake protein YcgR